VENYPGFPKGVQGPELVQMMQQQAEVFGAEVMEGDVTRVDLSHRPFALERGSEKIESRALIVASGASAKLLGLDSEKRLIGHGVSTCATCDGYFFRGKDVAVVGGGDTAIEEALFLTHYARQVNLIHRRDELRASKIMADRLMRNDKVKPIFNAVVTDVRDPDKMEVTGVELKDTQTGEQRFHECQGLFIGIGHAPNTALFRGQLEMDDLGYLKTTEGSRTSVPGVFAAGDVQDRVYRQAVTAAGSGCMAAIDAERFLASEH
jgi:thioredoxin reductase (NADPH)